MARLHTETIPTSTLASTARVVDGFVTTQTDHQGINLYGRHVCAKMP